MPEETTIAYQTQVEMSNGIIIHVDFRDDGAVLTNPLSMQAWWTATELREIADLLDATPNPIEQ